MQLDLRGLPNCLVKREAAKQNTDLAEARWHLVRAAQLDIYIYASYIDICMCSIDDVDIAY